LLTLAKALEVGMLDRFERDALREIERQITAADPELAAEMRTGQQRLARAGTRTWLRMMIALLVLLVAALLVLGVPASASAVAVVAAGLWWLRGYRFSHQEP
jgi:Flp pilus assembly protein TadB